MVPDSSFEMLISRLRDGDRAAAAEVFQLYLRRLLALASSRTSPKLRSKDDPEDVVQSVFLSFLGRIDNAPYELADASRLWSLLATITVRKCYDRRRYWERGRRKAMLEVGLSDWSNSDNWWELTDRKPTAYQAAVLAEISELLLSGLSDDHRRIAQLVLEGYTRVEVARICNCAERTVYRVIERLQQRIIEMDAQLVET